MAAEALDATGLGQGGNFGQAGCWVSPGTLSAAPAPGPVTTGAGPTCGTVPPLMPAQAYVFAGLSEEVACGHEGPAGRG